MSKLTCLEVDQTSLLLMKRQIVSHWLLYKSMECWWVPLSIQGSCQMVKLCGMQVTGEQATLSALDGDLCSIA